VTLVILCVALGGVAAAATLTVQQRQEASALFAERVEVGEAFVIENGSFFPVAETLGGIGLPGAPIELAHDATVRTALSRDHWVYAVTVREAGAGLVTSGTYSLELFLDGRAMGVLHVTQAAADPAQVESVRAAFDVGTALAPASLYYVIVKPVGVAGPTISLTVRSNPNGNLTWVGVGSGTEGVVNPTLTLAAGSLLLLTGRNADDLTHDLGLKTAGNALVDPPGWTPDFDASGEEETLVWIGISGTYTYQCRYHPTMKGTLVVTA
jgi:hypothetical protein